jgi:hypothetical protein
MIRVEDKEHGYAGKSRPAGQITNEDVTHQNISWSVIINTAAADANGYDCGTGIKEVDMIEEIRLIAVSAEATDTRRIIITGAREFKMDGMRVYAAENSIHGGFVVTPGLNYGQGLVTAHSRDARIIIPQMVNVVQKNLDGTPFTGDHRIRLYFNAKVHRFQ